MHPAAPPPECYVPDIYMHEDLIRAFYKVVACLSAWGVMKNNKELKSFIGWIDKSDPLAVMSIICICVTPCTDPKYVNGENLTKYLFFIVKWSVFLKTNNITYLPTKMANLWYKQKIVL